MAHNYYTKHYYSSKWLLCSNYNPPFSRLSGELAFFVLSCTYCSTYISVPPPRIVLPKFKVAAACGRTRTATLHFQPSTSLPLYRLLQKGKILFQPPPCLPPSDPHPRPRRLAPMQCLVLVLWSPRGSFTQPHVRPRGAPLHPHPRTASTSSRPPGRPARPVT